MRSTAPRGRGRVGSGVRRALAFFHLQVASWWELLIKVWHLEQLGNAVVSLPFSEVDRRMGSDDKNEYLRGKLHISDYFMIRKDCNNLERVMLKGPTSISSVIGVQSLLN